MNASRFRKTVGALLGIVSYCSWAEQGTIVDQATGRPLEGVVVVASFYGNAFNPVQPHTFCYHVDVAVSDEQGRFNIDRWSGDIRPWITNRRRGLSLFKAGYRTSPAWKLDTFPVLMLRFEGSVEERFRKKLSLPIAGSDCDGAEDKLLPLARAMLDEASQLAATTEQRMVASTLLFEVESTTLGREAAEKNARARYQELDKLRKRPASRITAPQVR